MKREQILPVLSHLISELVNLNFESVFEKDKNKRLTIEEIRNAIFDYPGKISNSSQDSTLDFYLYGEEGEDENIVEYDLWYDGVKSDNTLSVTIYKTGEYSIEDIHIL